MGDDMVGIVNSDKLGDGGGLSRVHEHQSALGCALYHVGVVVSEERYCSYAI